MPMMFLTIDAFCRLAHNRTQMGLLLLLLLWGTDWLTVRALWAYGGQRKQGKTTEVI